MKISIERVDNGFILKSPGDWDESTGKEQIKVFEENSRDEFGEHEALQKLFYVIIEELGLYGSKHDAKRLRVTLEEKED